MSIYDTHVPESTGSDLYLKLKDGETVKVRIASEPAIFESQNERDGKVTISTRYGWLVWNQDKQMPQVMQQSATFFKNIAGLARDEEYGDPTGYDIKITRQGTGTETTYSVVPSANRDKLSKEALKALGEIDLIEKLSASPFSQHVMWLEEFDKGGKSVKPAKAEPKPDVVATDIDEDKEINLDDIPF